MPVRRSGQTRSGILHSHSRMFRTMTQPSLQTVDLTVRFGGHVAVNAVSCAFRSGELTAIVGPNGAGKTTYFNLVSGQLASTAGQVLLFGTDVTKDSVPRRTAAGIGRAFQLTNLFPGLSVRENLRLVLQNRHGKGHRMWALAADLTELVAQADAVLERVKLHKLADHAVSALSHGDQRKLEVAMLIALQPKIYMFDEPTAGMSVDEAPVILDLIAQIKADPSVTVLLVEHKMEVLRSLADRIIVLHNGALVADGAPVDVMNSAVVREAYLGQEIDHV